MASIASAASSASLVVPSFESRLLSLTNADRARAGLAPMRSSATLVSVARSWSAHMAATGQLGHNPSLASRVSGWSALGENVAMAWSSDQAEQLFMASAGHRANILQPGYNWVGIGVVESLDGTYWFTVDFEQSAGYVAHSRPVASSHLSHSESARRMASVRAAAAGRASRSAARTPLPRARTAALPASRPPVASPAAMATAARLASMDARAEAVRSAVIPRPVGQDGSGGALGVLLVRGALGIAVLGSVLLSIRRATSV